MKLANKHSFIWIQLVILIFLKTLYVKCWMGTIWGLRTVEEWRYLRQMPWGITIFNLCYYLNGWSEFIYKNTSYLCIFFIKWIYPCPGRNWEEVRLWLWQSGHLSSTADHTQTRSWHQNHLSCFTREALPTTHCLVYTSTQIQLPWQMWWTHYVRPFQTVLSFHMMLAWRSSTVQLEQRYSRAYHVLLLA